MRMQHLKKIAGIALTALLSFAWSVTPATASPDTPVAGLTVESAKTIDNTLKATDQFDRSTALTVAVQANGVADMYAITLTAAEEAPFVAITDQYLTPITTTIAAKTQATETFYASINDNDKVLLDDSVAGDMAMSNYTGAISAAN
jgi:hypothetical protein